MTGAPIKWPSNEIRGRGDHKREALIMAVTAGWQTERLCLDGRGIGGRGIAIK